MLNTDFLETLQKEGDNSIYTDLIIMRKLSMYLDIFSNRGLSIEKNYLFGLPTLLYALNQTKLANIISENLLWKKGILVELSHDEYSFICNELKSIIEQFASKMHFFNVN